MFRKFVLNAIAWSAGVEVPAGGVEARFFTHREIDAALVGLKGTERAVAAEPIHALILTGHQHPGHNWQETTPVLKAALEQDPRFVVQISTNIEDLGTLQLNDYAVMIMNYCNWEQPEGLSAKSKAAFVSYLKGGGGLTLVHFANGSWHFSLPNAGQSDWPEFRNICRRVWDHKGGSGHDGYGSFQVQPTDREHNITKGMKPFETVDELYYNQKGDLPIQPLMIARSKNTGKDEPLAWAYHYGEGRVFQTVLGHAAESLAGAGATQLVRRGTVWAADRKQIEIGRIPVKLAERAATPPPASPLGDRKWHHVAMSLATDPK